MTLMIPQRPHIARHLTPRGVMRAGGAANEPRSSQRPLYCKLTVRPLASCRTGERNSPDYHGIFVATASSPLLWLCAAHTHGHMHRELAAPLAVRLLDHVCMRMRVHLHRCVPLVPAAALLPDIALKTYLAASTPSLMDLLRRADRALRHVPPEQVVAATDVAFAPAAMAAHVPAPASASALAGPTGLASPASRGWSNAPAAPCYSGSDSCQLSRLRGSLEAFAIELSTLRASLQAEAAGAANRLAGSAPDDPLIEKVHMLMHVYDADVHARVAVPMSTCTPMRMPHHVWACACACP